MFAAGGDPDETYPIVGDEISFDALVRDIVLLELPPAPLCSEACLGPDPARFPARVAGEKAEIDPRWAALSEISLDD